MDSVSSRQFREFRDFSALACVFMCDGVRVRACVRVLASIWHND